MLGAPKPGVNDPWVLHELVLEDEAARARRNINRLTAEGQPAQVEKVRARLAAIEERLQQGKAIEMMRPTDDRLKEAADLYRKGKIRGPHLSDFVVPTIEADAARVVKAGGDPSRYSMTIDPFTGVDSTKAAQGDLKKGSLSAWQGQVGDSVPDPVLDDFDMFETEKKRLADLVKQKRITALEAETELRTRFRFLSPESQQKVLLAAKNQTASSLSMASDAVLASNTKAVPGYQSPVQVSPQHAGAVKGLSNLQWDQLRSQLQYAGVSPEQIASLDPRARQAMGFDPFMPPTGPPGVPAPPSSPLPPPVIASPAAQQAARQAIPPMSIPPSSLPAGPSSPFPRQPMSIPPSSLPAGPSSPFPRQPMSIPPSSLPAGPSSPWPPAGGGGGGGSGGGGGVPNGSPLPPPPPPKAGRFDNLLFKAGGPKAMAKTAFSRLPAAGGWLTAGQLAGGVSKSLWDDPESQWDDATSSALTWGGTGAALGSMIMPGLGTAIGGVGGLVTGGIKGWFDGEGDSQEDILNASTEQRAKLDAAFDRLGVSAEARQGLYDQIEVQVALGAKSADEVKAIYAQAGQMAPDVIQQSRRQAKLAALQAAILPMMQQNRDMAMQRNQAAQGWLNQAASTQTDPTVASLLRAQGETLMGNAANFANASYGQALAMPTLMDLYGTAGPPPTNSSTGLTDYQSLLAQLQPAG
jgi:hypothetical protein